MSDRHEILYILMAPQPSNGRFPVAVTTATELHCYINRDMILFIGLKQLVKPVNRANKSSEENYSRVGHFLNAVVCKFEMISHSHFIWSATRLCSGSPTFHCLNVVAKGH